MTNLLTTTSFEWKRRSGTEDIKISNISGGAAYIPIVAFKNGGTAEHNFKGPYLNQNYLPRQYAYRWICLELLYPAAAFISAYLNFFIFVGHPTLGVVGAFQEWLNVILSPAFCEKKMTLADFL